MCSIIIFLSGCSKRASPIQKSQSETRQEDHRSKDDKCSNLDTLLAHSWRLAHAPHAAYFHFYERNDTLVNRYIIGKFKECLIGEKQDRIIARFGEPSYKDVFNIYYEFYSADNSKQSCLKFWIQSDTVNSIRYQLCWD